MLTVDMVLFDHNASYYFRWKRIIFGDFPTRCAKAHESARTHTPHRQQVASVFQFVFE